MSVVPPSSSAVVAPYLAKAMAIALGHHKGHCIYHSRQQCVDVLSAVEEARPEWYDAQCADFVASVRSVPLHGKGCDAAAGLSGAHLHPVIVLEGMDGSGKTTVATELVKRLPATLVRTPNPKFEDNVREKFRDLPEPIARAFYCAANYLAADEVHQLRQHQTVLLDRWWGSTCSMALASSGRRGAVVGGDASSIVLPPADSYVYQWPSDLLMPTCGVILDVDEEIRRRRAELRGGMKPEEHALAAKEEMRRAVKQAYRSMGPMYTWVHTPTWPLTVNRVIDLLEGGSSEDLTAGCFLPKGKALRCTQAEIDAVSPV